MLAIGDTAMELVLHLGAVSWQVLSRPQTDLRIPLVTDSDDH